MFTHLPNTRSAAVAQRSTKYFTGEPCRQGHVTPRYTQSGTCMGCIAAYRKRFTLPQTMQELCLWAHPDDVPLLREYAEQLAEIRGHSAHAQVGPPPATGKKDSYFAMRRRGIPHEIAVRRCMVEGLAFPDVPGDSNSSIHPPHL